MYDVVPWERALEKTGRPPIRTRWVDTNKGDTNRPDYRSRWVAQEFRVGPDNALYAATPPLEAVREVVSSVASADQKDRLLESNPSFVGKRIQSSALPAPFAAGRRATVSPT